jgi:hypothetical protein
MRLTLLGAGAMASARYAPAGLLVERGRSRVMLDDGPGAAPDGHLGAWLVTDDRSELIGAIRRLAQRHGLQPKVAAYARDDLSIRPRPVVPVERTKQTTASGRPRVGPSPGARRRHGQNVEHVFEAQVPGEPVVVGLFPERDASSGISRQSGCRVGQASRAPATRGWAPGFAKGPLERLPSSPALFLLVLCG